MPTAAENLRARFNPAWKSRGDLARLGREFNKVLRLIDEIPAQRAELAREGKLSEKGYDR